MLHLGARHLAIFCAQWHCIPSSPERCIVAGHIGKLPLPAPIALPGLALTPTSDRRLVRHTDCTPSSVSMVTIGHTLRPHVDVYFCLTSHRGLCLFTLPPGIECKWSDNWNHFKCAPCCTFNDCYCILRAMSIGTSKRMQSL